MVDVEEAAGLVIGAEEGEAEAVEEEEDGGEVDEVDGGTMMPMNSGTTGTIGNNGMRMRIPMPTDSMDHRMDAGKAPIRGITRTEQDLRQSNPPNQC